MYVIQRVVKCVASRKQHKTNFAKYKKSSLHNMKMYQK